MVFSSILGLGLKLFGAFVGGALFGPTGAAIGFGIGALASNIFFGAIPSPDNPPPQVNVPSNNAGREIVVVEGTLAVTGQLIWIDSAGPRACGSIKVGKGGLFQKDPTIKDYCISYAVAFCEAPTADGIIGISKIWLNDELWFDQSDTATEKDLADAQRKLADGKLKIYLGMDTQSPDPTIEADLGTGNVPAYRRIVYIVIKDLSVVRSNFGRGLPSSTRALIHASGSSTGKKWELLATPPWDARTSAAAGVWNNRLFIVGGFDATGDFSDLWFSDTGDSWEQKASMKKGKFDFEAINENGKIIAIGGSRVTSSVTEAMGYNGGAWFDMNLDGITPFPREGYGATTHSDSVFGQGIWLTGGACTGTLCGTNPFTFSTNKDIWVSGNSGLAWELVNDAGLINDRRDHFMISYKGSLYCGGGSTLDNPDFSNGIMRYDSAGKTFSYVYLGFQPLSVNPSADNPLVANGAIWGAAVWNNKLMIIAKGPATPGWFVVYESTDGLNWSMSDLTAINGTVQTITVARQTFTATLPTAPKSSSWFTSGYVEWLTGANAGSFIQINMDTFQKGETRLIDLVGATGSDIVAGDTFRAYVVGPDNFDDQDFPAVTTFNGSIFVMGGTRSGTVTNKIYRSTKDNLTTQSVALSDVVTRISTRTGALETTDIDVSALTADNVDGYAYGRESGKQSLVRLMRTFFFEAIESDFVIRFVKRGGSSVATVDEDDLAAHKEGDEQPDRLINTRTEELDLPKRVDISYISADLSYQEAVQSAQRIGFKISGVKTGAIDATAAVEFKSGIVMTEDKAAQVAHVLLFDAWNERNVVDFFISTKYAWLDPSDIITLTVENITYTVRIQKFDYSLSPGLIKVKGVTEDISIYTQSQVTGHDPQPVEPDLPTSLIPVESTGHYLDIPLLRADHDNSHWFYWAVNPSDPSTKLEQYEGAILYFSTSEESGTFSSLQITRQFTETGNATTILAAPSLVTVLDRVNSVQIEMHHNEFILESATELQISNGWNVALLGDEIIQFGNVTDDGSNKYTISLLARGLFGTEWAVGTHAVDDRFVLLNNVVNVQLLPTFPDQAFYFKTVTIGQDPDTVDPIRFETTEISLKPYAPIHVTGRKETNGYWTIEWIPRLRAEVTTLEQTRGRVGLREGGEFYELDFYDDNDKIIHTEEIHVVSLPADKKPFFRFSPTVERTDIDGNTFKIYGTDRNKIKITIYQLNLRMKGDRRGYGTTVTLTA